MDILADDLQTLLERRPALWSELAGASLFMTGGTGWFGRWLLEAIAHANKMLDVGIRAAVLTRDPRRFAAHAPHLVGDGFLTLHSGDVRNFDFPRGDFSHLIHAATTSAQETFNGAPPLAKFDTLVTGTRRVLDFAAQSGIHHVLFTSSGVAYGNVGLHVAEDNLQAPDPCDPTSALGQAKRAAEFLFAAQAAQQGWSLGVARCFAFVGPFMPFDLHYAIGGFIAQAVKGQPLIIHGDGSPLRSWLYAADLVIWLLTLLTRDGPPRIYNVGSDQALSIAELARLVRDRLNSGGEVTILGQGNASIGNPVRNAYVPSIRRAREELALEIWTPLHEAIERTACWAT
jgi:dTDP-glucose 4,6-dehydratase/UDP-glucose 4-epimerase